MFDAVGDVDEREPYRAPLATAPAAGAVQQSASDSSQGRATAVPRPISAVRREIGVFIGSGTPVPEANPALAGGGWLWSS